MRRCVVRMAFTVIGLLAVQISLVPGIALPDALASPAPSAAPGSAAGAPSPIPFALGAPPIISSNRNVIVLMGSGPDGATVGRMIASLATRLKVYRLINDASLVAEPTWSLTDFETSCKTDPTVAGAILTILVASGASQKEYYFLRKFDYQLAGGALWIACAAPKPKLGSNTGDEKSSATTYVAPCVRNAVRHLASATITQAVLKACAVSTPEPADTGTPLIGWVSPIEYDHDPRTLIEPYLWLNSALAIYTAYETFRPSVTTMSGSTTVYPTTAPIPRGGDLGSVTTSDSMTSNPSSGLGTLTGALYAQNINFSTTAVSLPFADEQSYNAANGVETKLVTDMNCSLTTTAPNASPTPPVGNFPAYNLGSVSYPRHNPRLNQAPFCAI